MAHKLSQEIAHNKFAPVYVFYGIEEYRIKRACQIIRERLVPEEEREMNEIQVNLSEVPLDVLIQEAETPPFFGNRRLIIGQNALFLTGTKERTKVEHNIEELLRYIANPLDSSVVILIAPTEKLDKRKKIVKELEKHARMVNFEPLNEKELSIWVRKQIEKEGAQIRPEAVIRLIELIGNDLYTLHNECKKLSTYVGRGGVVTPQMIDQLTPRTLEQDVFKLIDQVARRKTDQALAVLYDLLQNREEPIRILALIIRQFRILLQVYTLTSQGKSEREIASILGLHPYPVKLAVRQCRAFSEKSLRTLLRKAIEADQGIKTGRIEKRFALEHLLLQIGTRSST